MDFYWPLVLKNAPNTPAVLIRKTDVCTAEGKRIQRAIRLYCTLHRSVWSLQIQAPLGIGFAGLRDGNDDVIASASLSRDDLLALRAAIDEALAG